MAEKIFLDGFFLGQDIRKAIQQFQFEPEVLRILDDNQKRYVFPCGIAFKTEMEGSQIVEIRGGKNLVLPTSSEIKIGETSENLFRILGKPYKRMPVLGSQFPLMRVGYILCSKHIIFCFGEDSKVDLITLKEPMGKSMIL